jgi:hypothetical protein
MSSECPMHLADQYEAFAKLHTDHGMSAENIAERFGVRVAVLRQRLSDILGNADFIHGRELQRWPQRPSASQVPARLQSFKAPASG